jgi:Na+-translocating ferredoxin:NAD+ oxidoreductase subunit G
MSKGRLEKWAPAFISALVLGIFAVIGSTLVGVSYQGTAERIADNERQALLRQLAELVPPNRYDNDMLHDTLALHDVQALGGGDITVYRARKDGKDVAAVFSPVVSSGYAGPIALIVGIYQDGSIAGVRVLRQHETPGLGDKIELSRTPWVLGFDGKSLSNPESKRWKVKRDGGDFDQFTGATITPRLVVGAVKRTLEYFKQHKQQLFAVQANPKTKPGKQEHAHG